MNPLIQLLINKIGGGKPEQTPIVDIPAQPDPNQQAPQANAFNNINAALQGGQLNNQQNAFGSILRALGM